MQPQKAPIQPQKRQHQPPPQGQMHANVQPQMILQNGKTQTQRHTKTEDTQHPELPWSLSCSDTKSQNSRGGVVRETISHSQEYASGFS